MASQYKERYWLLLEGNIFLQLFFLSWVMYMCFIASTTAYIGVIEYNSFFLFFMPWLYHAIWSVRMAERLALPTSDHRVAGSNPAGGEILPEPKWCFIAQSLSSSQNDWNTVDPNLSIHLSCNLILTCSFEKVKSSGDKIYWLNAILCHYSC